MIEILVVVLPVFLVIGAGYAAVRSGLFAASGVDGLMSFTQNFAIPCLLFAAVARLDLGRVFAPGLLVAFYAGATISFLLGILGARLIFRRRPGEAVAIGFSALFSNSVLLGLPITARAFGEGALAPNYAIIALHAPFCYALGITVMEISRADGRRAVDTARVVLRAMFRNALMIGIALGLAVNLAGFGLPQPVWDAVDLMARASLPAALFGLGGVLSRYSFRASLGETAMSSALSLIVHPAITWTLAVPVLHLPQGFVNSAVLTAAMAPGVNTFLFASMYRRAEGVAAATVLGATALSVLTVPVWLLILRG
ncbi:MAG: malonate transporter [Paracoccaceae bacterium]|nr:MAG: malonate transporter [Paracoccaceae bacterium]